MIGSEKQAQAREAYKDGVSSREKAMQRLGIPDPAAEAILVDNEAQKAVDVLKAKVKAATPAHLAAEWIWRKVQGLDDEKMAEIKQQLLEQDDLSRGTEQETDI